MFEKWGLQEGNFCFLYRNQKGGLVMLRKLLRLGLVASMVVAAGCATMIRGTSETLYIESEPEGALAKLSTGQKCITPCQIKLKRNQTVNIKFEKEGCEPESITVTPTLAGSGVLLGGIVDYGTGAVYNLNPNPVHVLLKCKGSNSGKKKARGKGETSDKAESEAQK